MAKEDKYEGDPKYRMVTEDHFKSHYRLAKVSPPNVEAPGDHIHEVSDMYQLHMGPGVWRHVARDIYIHPSERRAYMALVDNGKIKVAPPEE